MPNLFATFIVPPLLILIVMVFIQSGAVGGAPNNLCIANANSAPCPTGANPGATSGQALVTCPSSGTPCNITKTFALLNILNAPYCTGVAIIFGPSPPPPAYCELELGFIPTGQILLPPGTSILLQPGGSVVNTNIGKSVTTDAVTFFFKEITTSTYGFVALILVAIGVVAIASIAVLGTALLSLESARILFIGGLLVAIWTIFSLADGIITGSSTSMLVQMNAITVGGVHAQFGSGIYLLLSLFYAIGVIGAVSGDI